MKMASGSSSIQVRGLCFSYPGRPMFSDWSMDFAPGITWIQGSNGSGKSTLLRLLGGALKPQDGILRINGVDAQAHPIDYRREVFWCGPGAIPFDHLRAPEYFGFMRSLYPRFDAAALTAHVTGLGLDQVMRSRLGELSTGTQRKVWLAASLAIETSVLLLDEPLGALDRRSVDYLLARLALLALDRSRSVVLASHEPLGAAGEAAVVLPLSASQS